MKKLSLLTLISCLGLISCGDGQQDQPESQKNLLPAELVTNPRTAGGMDEQTIANMPTMEFRDTVHDFGVIRNGDVVKHNFSFVNNGKNPLIISNATGSCGCTAPDYPKEPIPPGGEGFIEVQFNSQGRLGNQEKTVYLTTNSVRGNQQLYIRAVVKD